MFKKQVSVLATFTLVIITRKKVLGNAETSENSKNGDEDLETNFLWVFYIRYPIIFQKQFILALLNSKSKVNAIYPNFTKELGFPIRLIDIRVQKIDGTILDIYGIVIATFLMINKIN